MREYKGSHSGEHGDGIVRSEFHEQMFGTQLVQAFTQVKDRFDPGCLFNPGKIVRAPKFDDRNYLRYGPGYHGEPLSTLLDWSAYPGTGGGFQGAVEMCNNNGACRALAGGVMCPSFRVTGEEKDVTRGRANSLRLAITGQLGPDALTSDEMADTLKLCVSCKACRRECPTGVDMARMKIEVLAARAEKYGLSLRDRLIAYLPRYAPYAARAAWLMNLRDLIPGAAKLSEAVIGLSARRTLPRWRSDWFRDREGGHGERRCGRVRGYVQPLLRAGELARGAARAACRWISGRARRRRPMALVRCAAAAPLWPPAKSGKRGAKPTRTIATLAPFVARGATIVGLEPSCIMGFRDEIPAMIKGDAARLLSGRVVLFEEFLAREAEEGRLNLSLNAAPGLALLHGHCHQKSFDTMGAVEATLRLVPDLAVETIELSCCGMAGSFGFAAETIDVSLAMGELSLLPAVRKAPADVIVVANGTSCRHQIHDGTGRRAMHVAQVLARSLS